MSPDQDTSLNKAFVQLHERTRADAPPFAVMRDRAVNETHVCIAHPAPIPNWLRRAALAVTACVVVAVLTWWPRHEHNDEVTFSESASLQKVESVLSSIEHQIAVNEAVFDPVYPTDILIATTNEPNTP